ncbi:methyltransferase family protein [Paraburkholderia silvatlantica]|nr:methyltransferase family protein [Paraburkholderia silvatlantica]PXW31913.1 methyltransferase family protein [Paraburkholderia silvatlantica]
MHPSAMLNGKMFFDTYVARIGEVTVVDIGAQNVNGSLREVAPDNAKYIGVDFVKGNGVDIVINDPYQLPFEDESVDAVISSSCFEHSEMFWLVFNEILRILRPSGLFYLNAPSNGMFHRYPVDCWRFYPEAGKAMVTWARRQGLNPVQLESYVSVQHNGVWSDFIGVFLKDESHLGHHPERIIDTFQNFQNGMKHGHSGILKYSEYPEDMQRIESLTQKVRELQHRELQMFNALEVSKQALERARVEVTAANQRAETAQELLAKNGNKSAA